MEEDITWRSPRFRQTVVNKINESIITSGSTPKTSTVDIENHIFSKARSKDEYFLFVARCIIHIRGMQNAQPGPQPNPVDQQHDMQATLDIDETIKALENLALL